MTIAESLQSFFSSAIYSVKQVLNASMPTSGTAIDVTADDYAPGTPFTIFVGTGGDIVAIYKRDSVAVTLKNVADGTYLPGVFKEIKTSGTTAADIVVCT